MLKSMNFLRGKSRGIVSGGTKPTPPAPVILGLVPRILLQQGSNLVNKFALLLHKCWLREDSWDKPKNDWCRGRMFSAFCMFFNKYPSPAGGEGMHRPWCDKILGTDCASRSRMTGGRSADFVRLLRRGTPCNDVFNNTPHSALKRHSLPQGAREYGRSMIEMLGVLAIIGVLSVGGIAGYSKAMEMWKENRSTEQYSMLLYGMMEHVDDIKNLPTYQSYVDIAKSLNLIPNSWEKTSTPTIVIDEMDNYVQLRGGAQKFDFEVYFSRNNNYTKVKSKLQFCRRLWNNVAIPLTEHIKYVYVWRNGAQNQNTYWYGSKYCSNGLHCLSGITLADINEQCNSCTEGRMNNCSFVILF